MMPGNEKMIVILLFQPVNTTYDKIKRGKIFLLCGF